MKIEEIVKAIEGLSVADLVKLFDHLKDTFKITDDMLTVGSSNGGSNRANDEEVVAVDLNKKVSIVISGVGSESKLNMTKALKDAFGLGIGEINNKLTELNSGPVILKTDLLRKEADEIIAKLKAAIPTATLEIK